MTKGAGMTEGTALIVGVGPGLGLALARAFAAEGHQVALFGRDIERLTALSAEVTTPDGTARAYQVDVADADALQAALRSAAHDLGAPSVLVYNAARLVQDTPTGLDAEQLARTFAVNVTGAVVAARTVLPLLDGGRGTLLFTGGSLAVRPSPLYTSLSLGKAALRAYVQALHEEQQGGEVQVTTVTIDGQIGGGDPRLAPEAVAGAFVDVHRRPREEWEAELRY